MQISDIGTAARNLADYIDLNGESADMALVVAQVGLIAERTERVRRDKTLTVEPQELAVQNG
jgi:hypothetical protein